MAVFLCLIQGFGVNGGVPLPQFDAARFSRTATCISSKAHIRHARLFEIVGEVRDRLAHVFVR